MEVESERHSQLDLSIIEGLDQKDCAVEGSYQPVLFFIVGEGLYEHQVCLYTPIPTDL